MYTIPIHDVIPFRIKPNRNIPIELQNKMLMVKAAKGKTDVAKAAFSKGWYEAGFREFGEFWLEADTIPPTLGVMGIIEGGTITAGGRIIILADDNWDEIKNFRAELDGQWLRFVQRGNHFTYKVDEHCPPGEHVLTVTVEDEAGNTLKRAIRFIRK
jgi:hypothetical protein